MRPPAVPFALIYALIAPNLAKSTNTAGQHSRFVVIERDGMAAITPKPNPTAPTRSFFFRGLRRLRLLHCCPPFPLCCSNPFARCSTHRALRCCRLGFRLSRRPTLPLCRSNPLACDAMGQNIWLSRQIHNQLAAASVAAAAGTATPAAGVRRASASTTLIAAATATTVIRAAATGI
jgi:hypothetical protein